MDVSAYLETAKARQAARDEARDLALKALRARLPPAVRSLKQRFSVSSVVLFGSLVDDTWMPSSDVDLAVDGLSTTDYWAALDLLCRSL